MDFLTEVKGMKAIYEHDSGVKFVFQLIISIGLNNNWIVAGH